MKRNFLVWFPLLFSAFLVGFFALGGLKDNIAAEAHLKMIHTDKEKHEQSSLQLMNMAYVDS